MFSVGNRVEWVEDGRLKVGEITGVFSDGRHRLPDRGREWRATMDSPIYLIETETGSRRLVPHAWVARI